MLKRLLKHFPNDYEPSTGQVEIINRVDKAFSQGHKFCIVSAPTGTGKSFLPMTLANASNKPSKTFEEQIKSYEAYKQDFTGNYTGQVDCENEPPFGTFTLTITKALQDQYTGLFKQVETLKGKVNYGCELDGISTVDSYYNSRNNALLSRHAVLNYKMFLHLPGHVKRKNYIICDEASELENELVKMFSLYLDISKIQKLGIKLMPPRNFNDNTVRDWLYNLSQDISDFIESITKKYNKNPNLVLGEKIRISALKNIFWQINQCVNEWDSCEWIINTSEKNIIDITPLKVSSLTRHIFDYADQVVLMSATIIDHKKFAKNLGIDKYEYIEVESNFDPKQSPIYISQQNSINYSNKHVVLPKIAKQISELCEMYKDSKGIIHTHSLDITQLLQKYLRDKRFLFRSDIKTNDDILNKHFASDIPTVLVSPSLTHGVDLRDDLARFCIIVKLPYPPLNNKRIKKLFDIDKDWYENQMLNVLVQMCGRATRSKNDFSKTYILDGNSFRVLPKVKDKLPMHFFSRIN